MAFDLNGFQKAKFTPRTARVAVPALSAFFGKGEKPEFVVRQLTGSELAQTHEAVKLNRGVSELVSGLVGDDWKEKTEAIKKALGISGDVPDEIAKRIEQLVLASVEPRVEREIAVKLCANFPVEFYALTNQILTLSGEGAELGESKGFGSETTSEQP